MANRQESICRRRLNLNLMAEVEALGPGIGGGDKQASVLWAPSLRSRRVTLGRFPASLASPNYRALSSSSSIFLVALQLVGWSASHSLQLVDRQPGSLMWCSSPYCLCMNGRTSSGSSWPVPAAPSPEPHFAESRRVHLGSLPVLSSWQQHHRGVVCTGALISPSGA